MSDRLILASASPQRRMLLESLGIPFDVVPSTVDESAHGETDPLKRSVVLARLKAQDVSSRLNDGWILGCDTLVVAADGTLLEKPADRHEAGLMLDRQSGQTSVVHSAVCLIAPAGECFEDVSSSSVTFKRLSQQEKDWWLATGNWEGRSGGFQIDGQGQLLISSVRGDWTGVVGLPVYCLGELCRKAGFQLYR